jgi:formylglycine-generating enzyme required for sulfatase activity
MNRIGRSVFVARTLSIVAAIAIALFSAVALAQQATQDHQARDVAEQAASLQAASRALQPAQRNQASAMFAMGFKLFQESAFDAAKLGFERGLRIDPGNGQARFYLAETLVQLKQGPAAREQYELALALAPNSPEGLKAEVALANLAMTAGTVFRDCEGCPEMVVIPAGSFIMGSPGVAFAEPEHQVQFVRSFATGKYEVTFDEWDACVREGGCSHVPDDRGWGRGRQPVINVSWQDAKIYTGWLSRKSGKNYRLPSEAEWEYAARAGTTTAFSFPSITPQQANYHTTISYFGSPVATALSRALPVGSYAPNAFGLHDVHGNVEEWVEDCWNYNYSSGAPSDGSAWTSGDCNERITRGGASHAPPAFLRSAVRLPAPMSQRFLFRGFRLARTN